MTLARLAEAVEVTTQQVQKYENGTNRVSVGRLVRIAQAMRVSPSMLLEGPSPSDPANQVVALNGQALTPHPEITDAPDAVALLDAFARVRDIGLRRRLVELVKPVAMHADRSGGD